MTRARRPGLAAAAAALLLAGRAASAADPQDAAVREAAQKARDRVGAVFARPEFDPLAQADQIPVPEVPESAKSWLRSFFEVLADALVKVAEFVGDLLVDLLRWIVGGLGKLVGFGGGGGPPGGPVVGPWVGWVLAAAAAGLLAFLAWRLFSAARREKAARAAAATLGTATDAPDDDALAKSPEEWRRSARELAAGGAGRDALRALYLALLASLHRVGAIRYDRTRTNTAYVDDVDASHPAHAPFLSLTRRFDAAWYGGHEPTRDDLDAATREADAILAAWREEAVPA